METRVRTSLAKATVVTVLFSLICLMIFTVSDRARAQDEVTTTELFIVEKLPDTPNEEGIYAKLGYSVGGTTTQIVADKSGTPIRIETRSITDDYDLEGVYISTRVERTKRNLGGTGNAVVHSTIRTSPVHDSKFIDEFIANQQVVQFISLTNDEEQALLEQIQDIVDKLLPG